MLAGRTFALVSFLIVLSPSARAAPPELDEPLLGSGQLALSAHGAYTQSPFGREWLASISLVVPLDRFAMPRRPQTSALADPGAEPAPVPREVEIRLSPALARGAVRAALRAAGHGPSKRRLDELAARAKSSALLPELRLRGARTTDESLRLTPTTSDPYRYTQAGGSSLTFEARLTWKLDRLVFADEEIDVEKLRGQRAAAARTLVREVLRMLVLWQRASVRAADTELAPDERLDALLDALEAEAALDVLTDGWFSARLGRRLAKPADTR
jgi:hypothetical protein